MSALAAGSHFRDPGARAELEELLGRAGREHVHGPGDDPGPSRLVARADTGPVVPVEVLVEQEIVGPERVLLKLARSPVDRPPAVAVTQEDAGQPARDLLGDLVEVHPPPGARGTFDRELIAVV